MTEIYRDGKRVVSRFDDPTTITRRDRFAMAALTGLCAYPGRHGENNPPEEFARWSYAIADAMEAARNKEGAE